MKPPASPRRPAKPVQGSSSTAGAPAIPVDSGQELGFRDGFGEREASFDADGRPVELLRLLRGFNAVAPALTERIARLQGFHRIIVARALRLEHDEETGQLTLVSERPPGLRLRDLLRLAAERSVTPNVGATLLVMRRLLSTAELLHTVTGVTFTAVAPERIVLTPRGEIVLVEPALAGAIETITATSYEPRRDIAGIALAGISMLLGRPNGPVDALDALSALLKEAAEAAALVAGDTFANALRRWLHRAIIVEPYAPFAGFREARLTLDRIRPTKRSGCRVSRRKLKGFIEDLALEALSGPAAEAIEADRIRALRAAQVSGRPAAPGRAKVSSRKAELPEPWVPVVEDAVAPARGAKTAQFRAEEAARVREQDASARALEGEAARAREEEAAQLREERAARARDEEATQEREAEAARVREEVAAWAREEEAARARDDGSMQAREDDAARARGLKVERVREAEAAKVREDAARVLEAEAARARDEEAARAREAEAAQAREKEAGRAREAARLRKEEEEAARAREAEAARIREEKAARAREAEAARLRKEEEAARAREAEAARLRKEEEAARAREAEAARLREEKAARAREAEAARVRKEEEAARAREAEAARLREVEAARAREAEAARLREVEAARAREAEAARLREVEAARVREAEAARLREEEAARAREAEAARRREVEAARVREAEAARLREEEAARAREEEAAREREAKAARAREKEAARVLELEAARAREEQAARAREEEAARVREAKAARVREKEAARLLEQEAARAREEEAARAREDEKAARVRENDAARLREDEAAQAREDDAAQARDEDVARAREAKAARIQQARAREEEDLRALEAEAAQIREEDARAREEADAWLGEDEAARTHEQETAKVREAGAARARDVEADEDAAQARETASARAREELFVHGTRAELVAEKPPRPPDAVRATPPAAIVPVKAKPQVALSDRQWPRVVAKVAGVSAVLGLVAYLGLAARGYYATANTPGTVTVDSKPPGVEVRIDGAVKGVTPLTLSMKPGTHALELRRFGASRKFTLSLGPGAQVSQHVDWTNVKAVGTLAIATTPPGARVTLDGKSRGVTPLTLTDVPAGIHKLVLESSEGTIRRDVEVAAESEVTLNEPIFPGWIGVFAPFELKIYEGKRLLGTTESSRIMMPPGRHELQLVSERLGFHETHVLTVIPGETAALNISAALGIIRIKGPAGAEVWIDGERVGETPMGDLNIPVGTRDIVIKHPQLGEQRMTATVTRSAPTEVTVDFSKRPRN